MTEVKEFMIVKRDGKKEVYSSEKVIRVIEKAMCEGDTGLDVKLSNDIEKEIRFELMNEFHQAEFTVEQISDLIEDGLMKKGRYNTARRFIKHRTKRNDDRQNGDIDLQSKYYSKEFLKKYRYANEPFAPLGGFVKARTYARWIPEKGRRETWYETVKRAVEFNLSLAKHSSEEAEQLFHNVFYLKQNLSGRMTWLGGTKTAHSNALGLFNCAFDVADAYETFIEGFTVLMLGAGLGIRISKSEDVPKFPKVRNGIELIDKVYEPVKKDKRKEYTSLVEHSRNLIEIEIGDSRAGFTTALELYFKLMYSVQYKDVDTILMNYDSIRGRGERIKGFGGKASGYETLMQMFDSIHSVMQQGDEKTYKLKSIDVLDIICHIALNVVSGNVRRSSIMVLCDEDDFDIINAKNNLYINVNGTWKLDKKLEHRQMSNNTIIYKEKPSREKFHENFIKLRTAGEPATMMLESAIKRNPNAKGLNP